MSDQYTRRRDHATSGSSAPATDVRAVAAARDDEAEIQFIAKLQEQQRRRMGIPPPAAPRSANAATQGLTTHRTCSPAGEGLVPASMVVPAILAEFQIATIPQTDTSISERTNPFLSEALRLHQLGLRVIPLHCRVVHGKYRKIPPIGCAWKPLQVEAPTEEWLRTWFAKPMVNGLAVIHTNGLCVRDFDDPALYERWRDDHPTLATRLPTVRTRRGWHVYFRNDDLEYDDKIDGGELRAGSSHYTALPPTESAPGSKHQWHVPLTIPLPRLSDDAVAGLIGRLGRLVVAQPLEAAEIRQPTPLTDPAPPGAVAEEIKVNPDPHPTVELDPDQVIALIERTVPTGPAQRNKRIWPLVLGLRDLGLTQANACKPIVHQWWEAGRKYINSEFGETWSDFLRGWKKYDPEKRILSTCVDEAKASAPTHPITEEYGPTTGLVAALCDALQRRVGNQPFILSSHALLAEGIHQQKMMDILDMLVDERHLKRTYLGSKKSGKASEYKCLSLTHTTHRTHTTHTDTSDSSHS
jgi:hypothetical protein